MNEMSKGSDDKSPEEERQMTIPELVASIEAIDRAWDNVEDGQQGEEWMKERCRLRKELYNQSTSKQKAQLLERTFEEERKNYKWQRRKLGVVTFDQIMIDVWGCVPEYESLSDEERAVVDRIKSKNRWIK